MSNTESPKPENENNDENQQRSPGPLSIIQSVIAAAFGVQSEKKRQQDFQQGKPGDYILYGIIFTVIFIVTLIMVVNHIVDSAP